MGTRAATGLFGPYVEAPPPEVLRPEGGAPQPAARRRAPPDDLRLEVGVVSRSAAVSRRRWLTTSCSVVVHAAGLAATLALPLLLSSTLPEATGTVRAFLVDPLVPPPPPPPPPAPARPSAVAGRTPEVSPAEPVGFIAPIEVPSELTPEEGLDLGIGGVAGGVEGGVPGGVVGAVVGGLPDSPAEPPPPRPLRVSGLVREPVKIRHVAPVYPPVAVAGKIEGSVSLEALIDVKGRVAEVRVLEGNPLFEEAAFEAVRQWLYTPTLLDGVPVPLLLTVTVHFRLED